MDIKTQDGVKIVALIARVDAQSSREVEETLQELINAGEKKILCSFAGTEYISSAGLRVLLVAAKALKRAGGEIALCCTSSYVSEILETTGFTHIFKIYSTEEEALKALGA